MIVLSLQPKKMIVATILFKRFGELKLTNTIVLRDSLETFLFRKNRNGCRDKMLGWGRLWLWKSRWGRWWKYSGVLRGFISPGLLCWTMFVQHWVALEIWPPSVQLPVTLYHRTPTVMRWFFSEVNKPQGQLWQVVFKPKPAFWRSPAL